MVDFVLVVLHNKLHCPELEEPLKISAELLRWVEECNGLNQTCESILLWLSILRRIFSEYGSVRCDFRQRNGTETIQQEKLDWGIHLISLLLQQQSFILHLVHCLQSEYQLVSFLASKVLSLALQQPKCTAESWVPHLTPLLALPNHEPMYALQVMKNYIKMATKSQIKPTGSSPCPPVTPTLWHECKTALVSRLSCESSSKWPKLNFTVFLEICSKLIPYEDLEPLITSNLHHFIDLVNLYCHSLDILRRVVKLSLRVVRKLQSTFEVLGDPAMVAVHKAAETLLESALLCEVVRGVVSEMSQGHVGNGEWNLKKAVVRELVVLAMTLPSLHSDDDTVMDFEKMVSKFLRQCGIELSDDEGVVRQVQHHLVQLMCDQDTALVDTMVASLALWRKRPMLSKHFSLSCCFLYTRLHSILAEFLHTVCYDHSILLDFLISSETSKFVGFLTELAETCVQDWASVCEAWCRACGGDSECQLCREEDVCGGLQDIKSEAEVQVPRGKHPGEFPGDDEADEPAAISEAASPTDKQPYQETILDKIMDCFIQLKYSLTRLRAHNLLPFNAKLLISKLELMEDLYEK